MVPNIKVVMGYQYSIGNLTAALALAQVERVDELIAKKKQIFSWYYERLNNIQGIKIIAEKKDCKSNYCYPSILMENSVSISRDEVLDKLKALNIHCLPEFPRMSRFPVFEQRFPNPETE